MIFIKGIQSIAPFVQKVWSATSTHTLAQNNSWSFLGLNAEQCFFLGVFILSLVVCGIYVIAVQIHFQKHHESNDYHNEIIKFIN